METILSVNRLTKYYGSLCALHQVSFQVPKGSVFGILGPNGSGKTTLLGIVMDVLRATSGSFSWFNREAGNHNRKKIGTLLETPNFYPYLSARDNLRINAAIKECNAKDIDRVLKIVHLYERRHTAFKTFSLGMKQRLAIASALLRDPEIIVLDEPTNGLDPVGIADIRDLIIRMGASGKTVIIASHLLDEVEKVCTHAAILKQGKMQAAGLVSEILNSEDVIEVSADNFMALTRVLSECQGVKIIKKTNQSLQLTLDPEFSTTELNAYCFKHQVTLNRLQIHRKSLETKFLELTHAS